MTEKRKGIVLIMRWQKNFESLTDEQAGRMVKAMFKYEKNGSAIYFNDDKLDFFWLDVKDWLDDSRQHWQEVTEKRRLAGVASGESRKNKSEQMLTNVDKVKVMDKDKVKVKGRKKEEQNKGAAPQSSLNQVVSVYEKYNGKAFDKDREYFKACLNYTTAEMIEKMLNEYAIKRKDKKFSTEDFDNYLTQQTGIYTGYDFLD